MTGNTGAWIILLAVPCALVMAVPAGDDLHRAALLSVEGGTSVERPTPAV